MMDLLNIFQLNLIQLTIFQILVIFWLIRTAKYTFFYLYLWQLKEYHIGRFLDHFRTEKGKIILLNQLNFLKVILIVYFFNFPYYFPSLIHNFPSVSLTVYYFFPVFLLVIYFFEGLKFFFDLYKRKVKFPVLTKKAIFLVLLSVVLGIGAILALFYFEKDLNSFAFWLLLFDLFIFLIVSVIVLIFQPFVVLLRWQTIKKAKLKRESFKDLLVIGITGSYGKTSTKEFLYTILSKKFNVLKTKEHQNSEIGVSLCILNDLKPEHEIFIVEMGAYGRGGIKLLSDIAKPKIGILTGINEQHLALFGSQTNIIKAKYELIESLPDNGLAIFNGDNKYCLELYQKTEKPKKILSAKPRELNFHLDIWAEGIILQKGYIFFRACTEANCEDFKAYLSGSHFVPNLLAAICVAKELGMTLEQIAKTVLKIKSPKNTMNIFKGIKNLVIIDDSYSANPEGVFAALDYLKLYTGKKIVVLPCLIELGKTAKEIHYRIGEKIGEVCDAAIVTTKDYFQEIGEGFVEKGGKRENILFTENLNDILDIIDRHWDPGDIVLLEGRVPSRLIDLLVVSS